MPLSRHKPARWEPQVPVVTTTELPFFAGVDDDEQPVFESIKVEFVDPARDVVRLLHSPVFVRNLASGDHVRVVNPATAEYELERRSGNLCVRVMRKEGVDRIAEDLIPALEKLGGQLDVRSDRALIFSIHVSIGFPAIEELLNGHCGRHQGAAWYYGNVYDPTDGITPLLWWQDFARQD